MSLEKRQGIGHQMTKSKPLLPLETFFKKVRNFLRIEGEKKIEIGMKCQIPGTGSPQPAAEVIQVDPQSKMVSIQYQMAFHDAPVTKEISFDTFWELSLDSAPHSRLSTPQRTLADYEDDSPYFTPTYREEKPQSPAE